MNELRSGREELVEERKEEHEGAQGAQREAEGDVEGRVVRKRVHLDESDVTNSVRCKARHACVCFYWGCDGVLEGAVG